VGGVDEEGRRKGVPEGEVGGGGQGGVAKGGVRKETVCSKIELKVICYITNK
jgi:hypothetical protein